MTILWMKVECIEKLSCRKKSFCLRDQEKHTLKKILKDIDGEKVGEKNMKKIFQ